MELIGSYTNRSAKLLSEMSEGVASTFDTALAGRWLAKCRNLVEAINKAAIPEYEQKTARMGRSSRGGGASSGDIMPLDKMLKMRNPSYKKGGKIKSASARADGCCIRGKTKA